MEKENDIENNNEPSFTPNYASPPGDTIKDCLKATNKSVEELRKYLGLGPIIMAYLLDGELEITADICFKLGEFFNIDAQFWMNRELNYRKHLKRLQNEETFQSKNDAQL